MGISQENENCQGQKNCQSPSPRGSRQTHRLTFPKSARILSNRHFQAILRVRNRWVGTCVTIDYRLGKSLCPRLGITVSKKYGKAHDRNRFKRIVREAFRITCSQLPQDLEINIAPRLRASTEVRFESIEKDLICLLDHLTTHGS